MFFMLAILAGFWGPFNSMLIKHIINLLPDVKTHGVSLLIWPASLIVLNFIVFDKITWRTIGLINYKIQPVVKSRIINETLNYVLQSSHQFFLDNLSGRLASQIVTLADNIEHILHRISADFIRGASLVAVALVASYQVNPLFFYTLFIWFIVFSSFSVFMSLKLVDLADNHADAETAVSGQIVDTITNSSNIRIFGKRDHEIKRMNFYLLPTKKAFQKKELFIVLFNSVQGLMIAAMMGCSAYFLIYLYGQNRISIGDFALIFGISMELGHMIWYTMSRVDEFNQAVGKCKQSLKALVLRSDIVDEKNARELVVKTGRVTFDNVKFHYKGTVPLFENKSVEIKPGQKVGLVGYSGSGKSTFISLILRLYDVTDGQILIDGQNIKDVTQDSLRKNIGLIPQDPSLFHRSIMDNIRYGKTDATDEEVIMASKRAHAHDFIVKLAQGYFALVGERGVKLSGGQRQRIAIARAILKNAPLLILDEATSQLDSVTENLIQESLVDLMHEKTTFVVAHRLSTLLHMDRILVFDEGKIVEDEPHIELLNKNGLYKSLWDAQIGGFLPDKKQDDEI